jgi:predicted enzyme related to lactoylglutathione lyase
MSETLIKGIAFVLVYVDDFETSYKFYNEVLGLEKEYDMGKLACFFKLGADSGLYLQGGNKKNTIDDKTMRTAFTLNVPSASAMFEKLKAAGVKFVQKEPMDMGQENFWFQFYDPSGNILEILGGK